MKRDSWRAASLTAINMVNYKCTDHLDAMKPLYRNEQLCWNEALLRNEFTKFTNKLTDWWKIQCWLFSLENCRIWLENTRLVNIDDCNVQKSLLYEHSYKNNLVLQVGSRFKSIHYSLKSQCCVRTVLYFTGIFMLNENNSLRSLYIIAKSRLIHC